jgi:malonyl CoA-acyl carrier protein transacylase
MDPISNRFANLSPLKQALLALEDLQARLAKSESGRTEPIAIIGMGCRFPGAGNTAEFWSLLRNGEDKVREVPASRWKIDDYYDPDADVAGKMSTRWGGFLDEVDQFDAEFFGISPREAASMDPQQRLLLEVAWEALEDAGQGPRELSACQTGVFVGVTGDEYAQLFHRQQDLSVFNAYFASGIARSVAGGRVSYTLGIQGPNLSIDTACSSSLVAVHTACLNLRMGECRMALAGGVNVILSPEIGIAFSKAHMMAADGRCKAFDSRADGFVRAEGCGVMVLKRLSDAQADGDRILALIRGSSVNQDGRSSGLTVPNRRAQEAVIRQALANGKVEPLDIGYVEAHGTGTELGDPIEAQALAAVLGPGRTSDNPLVIGSVKTNLGHLESTAGIAGLIKTVLALHHQEIPRHLHLQKLNPHIDWAGAPIEIPLQTRPWIRGEKKRLAGVSAFGFSGTNAHVIVEEAPAVQARERERDRPLHILALSARSEAALRELGERYIAELAGTKTEVGDLCHTANAGRTHFEHRLAITGDSTEQLRARLVEALPGERRREREGIRAAFLFPGQGAQYPGMGKELYETQPVFRRAIEECAELLKSARDHQLQDVLWGSCTGLLDQTAYTQPALFAVEYAVAQLWASWGIQPAILLGHSVGEYVAACIAGVYSLADGLKLIAERSRLMQETAGQGAMAAVLTSEVQVQAALRGMEKRVSIAAFNAAESVVISGYREEVEEVSERLRAAGVRVQPLAVSHGFHSPQMEAMEAAFETVARGITYHAPQVRLISSVTGQLVGRDDLSEPGYWRRQVREPVRFAQAMERLKEQAYGVFVEVGPGSTLSGLGRQTIVADDALWIVSLRQQQSEWRQMLEGLSRLYVRGAEVNWSGFDSPYHRRRVSLPTYPFQRQRYWIEPPAPKSVQPAIGSSTGHPLLGRQFELAGESTVQVWESQIGISQLPYLADHCAFGSPIFPLTAYLEMMAATMPNSNGGAIELRDIEVSEALVLSSDTPSTIQLIRRADAIEIFSRQSDGWKRLVAARVAAAQPAKPCESLARLEPRMPLIVDTDTFYANIRDRGMNFGPTFRGICKLQTGAAESLAQVTVSALSNSDLAGYGIHPALLDACFQSLAGALPEGNRDLYLPVGLERFARYRGAAGTLWAHARLRATDETRPASVIVDLSIVDRDGIVAEAEGLELRRGTSAALRKHLPPGRKDGLFELQWQAVQRVGEEVEVEGDWLVVADRGGTGALLAERLREFGARCTLVDQASSLTAAVKERTLRGVIHLGALDAPPTDQLTPELLAESQRAVCNGVLELVQGMATSPAVQAPRLWLVTRGAQATSKEQETVAVVQAMLWGVAQAITEEHPEWRCTCVDLDPDPAHAETESLLAEIISTSGEEQVAFRGSERLVARLTACPMRDGLDVPQRVVAGTHGVLSALHTEPAQRRDVPPGWVEIEVAAAGVNFRDVLNVLGMLPGDPLPLGSECAGRIAATGAGVHGFREGDEVIAMATGGHDGFVVADAKLVARKPSRLTFNQSATLPTAFLTARYTLEHLAKMRRGDRVLIHAATGGVGLAAVKVAQRVGAEIFATAGSERKRAYLRSLGLRHVMDSRTLDFARQILEQTDGQGVNIVLNSLAGDFIPASFSALATGGCFLEIGKRDIWTKDQVDRLGRNIDYQIVDLGQVARSAPDVLGSLLEETVKSIERDELHPLPAEVFSMRDAAKAFHHMAAAQHIGKVVLQQDTSRTWISSQATYLIVGGFGALGLHLARWLVERGARFVVLTGRSGPGPEFRDLVEFAESKGARIVARAADVSRRPEMEAFLSEIAVTMPPLRGVIHAAAVLDDALLSQQRWDRFEPVLQPKVTGAWNLHELTRSLPLEFFILFSSTASIAGAPGQASYAAANAFEDALAHERRCLGMAALSVNWGAWTAGLASRSHLQQRQQMLGITPMSPDDALRLLDHALLTGSTQIGAGFFDWNQFVRRFTETGIPRRFSPLLGKTAAIQPKKDDEPSLLDRLRAAPESSRAGILRSLVQALAVRVLGFSADRTIDVDRPLGEMGLDSLMAVEFRNSLAAALGQNLPSTLLFDCPSVDRVSAYILRMLFNAKSQPDTGAAPANPKPSALDTIEELSDEEVDLMLDSRMGASR